jgi:hypothetical protein
MFKTSAVLYILVNIVLVFAAKFVKWSTDLANIIIQNHNWKY